MSVEALLLVVICILLAILIALVLRLDSGIVMYFVIAPDGRIVAAHRNHEVARIQRDKIGKGAEIISVNVIDHS